ncbi:MAG: carboxypeptidase regulatory-like domain-containing protein, partial [Planctomycetota bacterium]
TAKPERLSKPPDFHSQIQAESESAGKLTLDIRGLVLDDLGQPVPKAEISIVQSLNYSKSTMKDWKVKNLRTDVEGRYHHSEDIKTGEYFSYIDLTIRFIPGDTGLLTSARQIKSIRNNISETVDFRLRKGGSFSGRLVDKYGSPVPHCNMGYKSAGGHPSRLLTDKNGRFTSWTSLPTAYYSLCVCRSSNRSSSNRMGVYRPLDDSLSWLITASFHTDISDIIVVGRTGIRVTIDSKTVYD